MRPESLSFRPHARLLTMLGEQLIKNERIALVELVRNAYDADADHVEIRFEQFRDNMTPTDGSRIVVRDDGTGMTVETLRNEWMNPATPRKLLAKRAEKRRTIRKKRVIQGEKGIGRFAVLKLGRKVTIATRTRGAGQEAVVTWDFSRFDSDFVLEDGNPTELYLDQIAVAMEHSRPTRFCNGEHGTVIEIEGLHGNWGRSVIRRLCRDVSDLTDPVSRITKREAADRLDVSVFCNGERQVTIEEASVNQLRRLIEDRAVLSVNGGFHSDRNSFVYRMNAANPIELPLHDSAIQGLWVWRERVRQRSSDQSGQLSLPIPSSCGSFDFHFFVFDFSRGIEGKHFLTPPEKRLIKDHRVYLYRDGMRVYPYGDPDDDWLAIDVTRGIGRAGNFFSNDQLVGWIDITQEANPALRDKTDRDGLIATGGEAEDLIFLVQVFLSYLKQRPFAQYQHRRLERSTARLVHERVVGSGLAHLRMQLRESGHASPADAVAKIEKDYRRERSHLVRRAEVTEDLAGVGLSVEMASHDIMLLLARGQDVARMLAQNARDASADEVVELADRLIGVLQQVVDSMGDVQTLFKSSQRRRKRLKIAPVLDKIYRIYKPLLDARSIRYDLVTTGTSPLVASTTDGVVMQVLINLFDNACYWMETVHAGDREILVRIDGDQGHLTFSDSGPGIDPDDLPFIFDAFYSGKGQEGRGLGLYIARQLLERHDYRIRVVDTDDYLLAGANFRIHFTKDDSQ